MEALITRQGKNEYIKFKSGGQLSHKEAILAQCYVCYLEGADPKELDCLSKNCSLYAFQPYNPNPNKKRRILSEEEKLKISERLKKGLLGKKLTAPAH
ncbi:MAG: hypothetical protein M1467_00230 [Deltaproteobacteria bacterium]|jgi:hypothetical protein|nr:hypothetical protein [Deltaproteobacteria bacterium]MCL5879588.1 hypothetical protein [Deltaproteobacteria bacterium]